jgi:hypothetical protein
MTTKKETLFFDNECDCDKFINIHSAEMDDVIQLLYGFLGDEIVFSLKPRKARIPLHLYNLDYDYHWKSMPEYVANETDVKKTIITLRWNSIDSDQEQTINDIIDLFGRPNIRNNSLTYPPKNQFSVSSHYWTTDDKTQPKYPIYIISKGRHETRLTSKYLEFSGINYKIVVEPQEYELYAKNIDPSKILILPDEYCGLNQGGIPARNFVWRHSRANGDKRHWILDDNIYSYVRVNNGKKIVIKSPVAFRIIEDFVDRMENVKMAGHNYTFFNISSSPQSPLTINTRIYSSILLSNDIDFEWRGRYNEDTDLSLRILKAGYTTILFNAITANKATTLTCKGGNTDTIYAEENGLLKKAQQIADFHPDCAKVIERFGRPHHFIDYTKFKKPLKLRDDYIEENETNNFGMYLIPKASSSLMKLD